MARHKNIDWNLPDKQMTLWEQVNCALFMDIRDELQKLNRVFECPNFLAIPRMLAAIDKNTRKVRRKRRTEP